MGTNIYLIKKVNEEDIKNTEKVFNEALQDMRDEQRLDGIVERVLYHLNSLREEVHICKRSGGWQLLFQSHKDLYDCTWKSMTDYIKKVTEDGTHSMIDEYGSPYSLEKLEKDLNDSKGGLTSASYAKKEGYYYPKNSNEYISDNLRWTDDWFC